MVQSYLQWLQDSDYNPNCAFCDEELANESCVRLSCYRKFTSHNVYCLILSTFMSGFELEENDLNLKS